MPATHTALLPSGIRHSTATSTTRKADLPCAHGQSLLSRVEPTSNGCNPATSSYIYTAPGTCKTCSVVEPIIRSAAFSRWGQGSLGEAGGKADQKPQAVAPLTPKQLQHPLLQDPAASLPWSVSVNSGHQGTARPGVFSNCITWLLKDMASPSQPLAQADLGYYRRDCTLLMNQGRELSK